MIRTASPGSDQDTGITVALTGMYCKEQHALLIIVIALPKKITCVPICIYYRLPSFFSPIEMQTRPHPFKIAQTNAGVLLTAGLSVTAILMGTPGTRTACCQTYKAETSKPQETSYWIPTGTFIGKIVAEEVS